MVFQLKEGVRIEDLLEIQPALWLILVFVFLYCHFYKLPCVITSLINDREGVRPKSNTHKEGRAFDLRRSGIPDFHIERICYHVNKIFKLIAAISSKTGKQQAAVLEEDHIHFQVKPLAPYEQFLTLD